MPGGTSTRYDLHCEDEQIYTGMHLRACEHGHEDVAAMLVENHSVDIHTLTFRNKTPLYAAAEGNHAGIARLLLGHGAWDDIAVETTYGTTPLFIANRNGCRAVEQLFNAYALDGKKSLGRPAMLKRKKSKSTGSAKPPFGSNKPKRVGSGKTRKGSSTGNAEKAKKLREKKVAGMRF